MNVDTRLEDRTCQRCGSDLEWEDCENCTEGYVHDGEGDDGHYENTCEVCDGDGGKYVCIQPSYWCKNNPLPGYEGKVRGA